MACTAQLGVLDKEKNQTAMAVDPRSTSGQMTFEHTERSPSEGPDGGVLGQKGWLVGHSKGLGRAGPGCPVPLCVPSRLAVSAPLFAAF